MPFCFRRIVDNQEESESEGKRVDFRQFITSKNKSRRQFCFKSLFDRRFHIKDYSKAGVV